MSVLLPGDRVAVEPGVPCRVCEDCKKGKYHLCPDVKFSGCPPFHGMITHFHTHPADFCFK